jgi:hypothetical protein
MRLRSTMLKWLTGGVANAVEEDGEVVYPGVVGLACAEGKGTGVLLQFAQ